ncbi:metal ABC transporter permease, partial [Staphylococcus aureus]
YKSKSAKARDYESIFFFSGRRRHTRWLHYGLLCMVSLTIVATLKAVGIILSISLLIAPGAIAVLLTQRFHIALLLATGISVIVSMTGVWLSFFIGSAPA